MSTTAWPDSPPVAHPSADPVRQHIPLFGSLLSSEGYTPASLRSKFLVLYRFSRWLGLGTASVGELNDQSVEQFLKERSRAGRLRPGDCGTMHRFVDFLRDRGLVASAPQLAPTDDIDRVAQSFAAYLERQRGLSKAAVDNYVPVVRRFLHHCFDPGPVTLGTIASVDVTDFVVHSAADMSPRRAQLMATALRSFLRYLCFRGDAASDLSSCVPSIANRRFSTLPTSLEPGAVERLLACCDRTTAVGRRDYAVLLLLARLGLRGGEIVAMGLDDIDWLRGTITIRGKGQRRDQLPLPQDAGEALATYLREARPRCQTRRVFIRGRAPLRGFSGPAAVGDIVRRALGRAGMEPPHKGAHLLRHSLATNMLRRGATVAEIGEILRHCRPATTQIYARVDLNALSTLVQPWPEVSHE
jgi:site-specific recombinase XerD